LLTEQMERVAEPMGRPGGGEKPSDGGEHRGGRGGRGGGGPGGVGVGVGAGGASINLPGGG
jgi:hypothetical protein